MCQLSRARFSCLLLVTESHSNHSSISLSTVSSGKSPTVTD